VDFHVGELRVGPGEVDVLEDAESAGLRRHRLGRAAAVGVDHDQLSRLQLALVVSSDEVERARLRGDRPVVAEPPERERAKAVRVAQSEQLPLGERDDGVSALEPRRSVGDRLLERGRVVGDQRRDHLGVGRRRERDPLRRQLLA
jgi:hypothetical protein